MKEPILGVIEAQPCYTPFGEADFAQWLIAHRNGRVIASWNIATDDEFKVVFFALNKLSFLTHKTWQRDGVVDYIGLRGTGQLVCYLIRALNAEDSRKFREAGV